jgi:polyphosphate kinase
MRTPASVNLKNSKLYLNRELSWLEFNRRVLAQARDPNVPLLERLFYLCVASSNMDEFFEIRVAGLKQQAEYDSTAHGPDLMNPAEQLQRISKVAHALVDEQYALLNDTLMPAMAREGIQVLLSKAWTKKQNEWIKSYFNRELLPVLSPISLDPAHPFPQVLNKSLNFIISLEGKDAFGRNSGLAIVQAPRALPRMVQLPPSSTAHPHDFVMLSSIIFHHARDLFPGMRVIGCYQFRVTRNADLTVQEDEGGDLMHMIEGKLTTRRFASAVRLEVQADCPLDLATYLMDKFDLQEDDVYLVGGPVNLNRMLAIQSMVKRPDLKFPVFEPAIAGKLQDDVNLFDVIRKGNVLLHQPFQSFSTVVDFLRQAAADPDVLVIKQTLYRTGNDSSIVDALVQAALRGKEVTVVIELRARFDEEENIEVANELQEAGAHVSYGVVGHKTHAKMVLIVRREGRQLKRYVHLGTGNYHARTARQYTDFGLFTADLALTEDVQKVFQQLTAMGKPGKLKKILQAPFTLHKALLEKIDRETMFAGKGRPARIIAKLNALTEPSLIEALYRASKAGVRIDLIVRGTCCLRPGIKGVSENIHVRSIIGRFLEHSRLYYFHNNGDFELYASSADWMERNLFRRVETAFPIEDRRMKQKVLQEGLLDYLSDNVQSWLLQSDGSYKRSTPGNSKPRSAQNTLLQQYTG